MEESARAVTMLMTAEEFLVYPIGDVKAELVRGELRVTPPPGSPHAYAANNLLALLLPYVKERSLGRAFGDGVGYQLMALPHTVRVPDASFVRAGRLPKEAVRHGLFQFPPDLAVEVLSPSETASELTEKLDDYRACGTPLIWVVDPARRSVAVYANNAPVRWLHEHDSLDGGEIIPGFSCGVSEIFEGIARDAR